MNDIRDAALHFEAVKIAREKNRERCRRYYLLNAEKVREYGRRWYSKNKDRALEARKKYAKSARGRAVALMDRIRKSGHETDLTVDWIQEGIGVGCCPVTGVEFDLSSDGWSAFAPSVDRIDSKKPYTQENCRVVAVIFNLAKNQFSDEDVMKMARAMVAKHGA